MDVGALLQFCYSSYSLVHDHGCPIASFLFVNPNFCLLFMLLNKRTIFSQKLCLKENLGEGILSLHCRSDKDRNHVD